MKKVIPWLLLSVFVVVVDQLSKYWVLHTLSTGNTIHLLPFFNFIFSYNQGAAFGFLRQTGSWHVLFLSGISIIVIVGLLIGLLRLKYPNPWIACALALVMGGAIGNLIDRIRFSVVIDFLDFHIGDWHYATFNIADSAIVIGVIILLFKTFIRKK